MIRDQLPFAQAFSTIDTVYKVQRHNFSIQSCLKNFYRSLQNLYIRILVNFYPTNETQILQAI